ncbi:hypothetical protein O6H91_09G059900 [Diphasiastrum complanatum]|uniref:Uncharacterized protein n=1 Tax=Diphasiastrum complanatum TaxID=34168 RepID=A0ACC2CPQ0_DIPCM|nr:hypothetical protein O6H91_09G059900 [Diphasiastrum complanatum]
MTEFFASISNSANRSEVPGRNAAANSYALGVGIVGGALEKFSREALVTMKGKVYNSVMLELDRQNYDELCNDRTLTLEYMHYCQSELSIMERFSKNISLLTGAEADEMKRLIDHDFLVFELRTSSSIVLKIVHLGVGIVGGAHEKFSQEALVTMNGKVYNSVMLELDRQNYDELCNDRTLTLENMHYCQSELSIMERFSKTISLLTGAEADEMKRLINHDFLVFELRTSSSIVLKIVHLGVGIVGGAHEKFSQEALVTMKGKVYNSVMLELDRQNYDELCNDRTLTLEYMHYCQSELSIMEVF